MTQQRVRRAADARKSAKANSPAKRAPAKTDLADRICDAIDAAEHDDLIMGLANGNLDAAAVLRTLNDEQLQRTNDMKQAQLVYLQLAQDISYPVDQAGRVHDLQGLATRNADPQDGANSTLMAIFWTMSLLGYRKVGPQFIKQRPYKGHSGVYANAHTWVDARQPDDADEALADDHSQHNRDLPPDVRAAAARRDGDPGMRVTAEWHTMPKPIIKDGPRPEGF